jgi:hypothetical protein
VLLLQGDPKIVQKKILWKSLFLRILVSWLAADGGIFMIVFFAVLGEIRETEQILARPVSEPKPTPPAARQYVDFSQYHGALLTEIFLLIFVLTN